LHIVEPPTYPSETYIPPDLITTVLEALERDANDRLAQPLSDAKASHVDLARHVMVGLPYQSILESAQVEKVDLIIMATRRSNSRCLLLPDGEQMDDYLARDERVCSQLVASTRQ
jgi:nucleotide-binding universal stress UspA family protein